MKAVRNYIRGAWVEPTGDNTYKCINPSNFDEILIEYRLSGVSDVATAVAAAKQAAGAWAATSPIARGEILRVAAAKLRERVAEIGERMAIEVGKPIEEALAEVTYSARVLEFYAAEGPRLTGETLPSLRPGVVVGTVRKPLGVVGLITPWNFPMSIAAWKVGPALVAGNAAVWKPCLHAPFTSMALAEALEEAGLPAGVLNLVHGDGFDVGQAIVDHPDVAGVSFTGSKAVGYHVYSSVSARQGKVQCELGGKNALVVLDDADVELAVTTAIEGAFRNSGQKCTATSRIIVQQGIRQRFTEYLVERTRALKVGNAIDRENYLGPLVDRRQYEKVRGFIERASASGATMLCGDEDGLSNTGYFVRPAIFDNVARDSELATQEVFGPVVALFPVDSLDEAIELANDTEYGLSASICTQNLAAAHQFVSKVVAGVASVNLPTAGVELHAPFGGTKASGLGVKEQGRPVLDFYTEWQTVYMKMA